MRKVVFSEVLGEKSVLQRAQLIVNTCFEFFRRNSGNALEILSKKGLVAEIQQIGNLRNCIFGFSSNNLLSSITKSSIICPALFPFISFTVSVKYFGVTFRASA